MATENEKKRKILAGENRLQGTGTVGEGKIGRMLPEPGLRKESTGEDYLTKLV